MSYKDKLRLIVNDFSFLSKKLLKIKDKKGNIVPFIMNSAQEQVYKVYEEQRKKNVPIRLIVLKARQEGVSTLFEGIIFQRNSFAKNRKAVIIGHVKEASDNLFAMFKRYYKYLPEAIQPELSNSNRKELKYKRLDSEISVYTAENTEAGRSATIQDLHGTEVAFYRDANTTMTGLLQTIPDEPNTMVVLESTANGIGGYFADMWRDAVAGRNDYKPIFLPWFAIPEYSKDFGTRAEKDSFILSDEEKALKNRFNLTLEQMNWYRYTLRNKLKGDIDKMRQEYPSTAQEAFIVSGRPVFDVQKCSDNYNNAKDLRIGNLTEDGEFIPSEKGFVRLHENIEVNERETNVYAAGVDVAEGLEQGDYSVCKVLDRRTDRVVLTWHGHIDPDLFAGELMKIQKFLKGKVYFEIEKNNHGIVVIYNGYNLGLNIKYREVFDSGYVAEKNELGFVTNLKSKPFIIDRLSEWIRENLFTDTEKEFWGECLTFVRDSKGRMNAQNKIDEPGTKIFDDRVIAGALMVNCSMWLPNYNILPAKEQTRLPEEELEMALQL